MIFYSLVVNDLKWPAAFDMLSQKTLYCPIGNISPIYFWLCHAHRFQCVNFLQLLFKWHFLRENDLFKHLSWNCKDITLSLKFVAVWPCSGILSPKGCHWWLSMSHNIFSFNFNKIVISLHLYFFHASTFSVGSDRLLMSSIPWGTNNTSWQAHHSTPQVSHA